MDDHIDIGRVMDRPPCIKLTNQWKRTAVNFDIFEVFLLLFNILNEMRLPSSILLSALLLMVVVMRNAYGGGTTRYIQEVFLGRCHQYQILSEQNEIEVLKTNVNCTQLWNAFVGAFAFKDACNVTDADYNEFFGLLHTPKKIPNALFYSGAHDLVTDFTFINDEYICLEDTLTGYLMNNLVWCGSPTSHDGLNYKTCYQRSEKCNAMYPAWRLASAKFADRATGVTQTLLNASRSSGSPAYANGSYFRTVEMPRLKVDKIIVYLASRIDQPIRERCKTSSSVRELEADAKKRNIKTECYDQPKFVLDIYCIKSPNSAVCKAHVSYFKDSSSTNDTTRKWKVVVVVISTLFIILAFVNVILWRLYSKLRTPPGIEHSCPLNGDLVKSDTVSTQITLTEENGNNIWLSWKTISLVLVMIVAALVMYIAVCMVRKGICFKESELHSSWSFSSKKDMLKIDEDMSENNNETIRIV